MSLTLNTNRLVLREITEKDFNFIVELETRPENKNYETEDIDKKDSIINDCNWFIEMANELPEGGAIKFIVINEKNEMIGDISLTCNWEETQEWEIAYTFLREYWGNGYATEALRSIIKFAFEKLHIHKLMAFINSENTRSVALAKRTGMIEEAHMREARFSYGKWQDELVFTLLKTDLK